jgi:hypothetical protein
LEDVQRKIKEEEEKLLKATEEEKQKVKESLQNYNNERRQLMDQLS